MENGPLDLHCNARLYDYNFISCSNTSKEKFKIIV